MEVTCRTVQGRLLLRPSRRLNEIVLGVLGRAQARYGMTVHAFVAMSNHLHLLLSPSSPRQLARFMGFVAANLAKEAGRMHFWRGPFWARRYQAIVVTDEEEAQMGRLLYILRHGVKERLVACPEDWPGAHSVSALLEGRPLQGLWIDRTLLHRLRRKDLVPGDQAGCFTETLVLAPLPCWRHLSSTDHRGRVAELIALVDEEGRRLDRGGEVIGGDRVLRQNPHEQPMRSKRSPAPLVHAACRAMRLAFLRGYRLFVAAYRLAAAKLRAGDRLVEFPERAFPPPLPAPT